MRVRASLRVRHQPGDPLPVSDPHERPHHGPPRRCRVRGVLRHPRARRGAAAPGLFFVTLDPGGAPPLHVHEDAEQVFFVLEGEAELTIGREAPETMPVKVGDLVRPPPGTWHSIRATGDRRFVYLSIDCFTAGPPAAEPTWDCHVRAMCELNGWDFDAVRLGPIDAPVAIGGGSGGRS